MVTIIRDDKNCRFIELDIGEFFEYDGALFVKVARADNVNNSFNIEDSQLSSLKPNDTVMRIDGLTITY